MKKALGIQLLFITVLQIILCSSAFSQFNLPFRKLNNKEKGYNHTRALKETIKKGLPVDIELTSDSSIRRKDTAKAPSGDDDISLRDINNKLNVVDFFKKDNDVAYFYNQIYGDDASNDYGLMNHITSQLFGKNSYIGAEFFSYYFKAIPTRLGIGANFKATGDSANKTKSSLQNVIQNGGSLFLNFDMPLLYTNPNRNFIFGASFFNNWSFNSSSNFNSDTSTIGVTWQPGINLQTYFNLYANVNNDTPDGYISLNLQGNYFTGSQSLLKKFGTSDFGLLQLKLTLALNNVISFYVQYPLISSSSYVNDNLRQVTGGIQFSPSQIFKNKKLSE